MLLTTSLLSSNLGKTEKDEHSSPSGSGEAPSSRSKTTKTRIVEGITMPALDLNTEERLHPSTKIKLQLFPIDESTRLGLEKVKLSNRNTSSHFFKDITMLRVNYSFI